MQWTRRCWDAYIKYKHANGKRGFDNLHQEVDADRIEAELALRILAQVHQHWLQACNMQTAPVGGINAANVHSNYRA